MANVHVKGLSDLQTLLNTLPAKVEANVLRGAMRQGAKVVLAEAKANVAAESGVLRDGLKISTRLSRGRVTVSIKAKGKHAYLAHWVEFGTRPHKIDLAGDKALVSRPNKRASKGQAKRWIRERQDKGAAVNIASAAAGPALPNWVTILNHPGVKPRPFMRPALDNRAADALKETGEYIRKRLATKHGLDTADIVIELDDE